MANKATVSICLPRDIIDYINTKADRYGISKSSVATMLIIKGVEVDRNGANSET